MTNPLFDALLPPSADAAPFLTDDAGTDWSFAALRARTGQVARALVASGLKPGDRVVSHTPKTVETVALYLATVRAGGVYLPLNTAYTHEELRYFISDATPAVIVCHSADAAALGAMAGGAAVLTLDPDGSGTLATLADLQDPDFATVARADDDLAALLYTSGTTGRSKGAMLTQRNLLSNAQALVDLWRITDADHLIHALPIFHTHGLFVALNTTLLARARVRFMARFDLGAIIATLPRATMLMGVPTFYTRLLDDPRLTRDLVAPMRLFISGSAPLLAETHRAFTARTGHAILERYGMTETNMITSNPYDGARVPGSVGYAIGDCEVIVADAQGAPLPPGEIGVIEVRGSNVFKGYWQMPEKTREELRPSGFFITGDLGVMEPDGRVSIVGRQKDLIISGGFNIYPIEIEDAINTAPGVLESAVYGIPDPDFGEAVVAAVVMEPGAAPDEGALRAHLAPLLARFKQPKVIRYLPELPRNTMGKVQKAALRQQGV